MATDSARDSVLAHIAAVDFQMVGATQKVDELNQSLKAAKQEVKDLTALREEWEHVLELIDAEQFPPEQVVEPEPEG